ncbi:MAG TPA: DMT family transporter [Gemmatimonadaceae bacterium]|nr:DMT family transporter [Gemmatimonadaceae bacterium]
METGADATAVTERRRGGPHPYAVLALALLAISTSGPLVRASSADPLAIAVWRLGFSLVVVAVALLATGSWRELRHVSARELLIALLAGIALALHFWSWNASIHLTTVAASVVLVNMHPPFVALLSMLWLGEKPRARQWLGIAVAMLGAGVIALADTGWRGGVAQSPRALFGDLLALIGAVTVAIYFVAGRRLRARHTLWPYVAMVYGAAFLTLVLVATARGVPLTGYPPRELSIFAALAAGPMLLGHTGMNYALRYLPAYVVNLTVLGEPVGATLIAFLVPAIHETPSGGTILGGIITLLGLLIAATATRDKG